jgi:hypothetical protein
MVRKRLDKRLEQKKDLILDSILNEEDTKKVKEFIEVYKVLVAVIDEEKAKRRKK